MLEELPTVGGFILWLWASGLYKIKWSYHRHVYISSLFTAPWLWMCPTTSWSYHIEFTIATLNWNQINLSTLFCQKNFISAIRNLTLEEIDTSMRPLLDKLDYVAARLWARKTSEWSRILWVILKRTLETLFLVECKQWRPSSGNYRREKRVCW